MTQEHRNTGWGGQWRRRWRSRRAFAAPLLAVGLIAAACGSPAAVTPAATITSAAQTTQSQTPTPTAVVPGVTQAEILIGTNSGMTGPQAAACGAVPPGAQAWYDVVNAKGGINGRKIRVSVRDDAYLPPNAVTNWTAFVQEKVFAVVGGCGSGGSQALAPLAQRDAIPYLFPLSGAEILYKPLNPYVFAIQPSYPDQAYGALLSQLKKLPKGSVALVTSEVPGYEGEVANAQKATAEAGDTWLTGDHFPVGTTNYTPQALKLKTQAPDYLWLGTSYSDSALLIKAMSQQGFLPKKIFVNSGAASDVFLQVGGSLADTRLVVFSVQMLTTDPGSAECVSALQKAGVTLTTFSLFGCSGAQLFTKAVDQAGPNPTRASLVAALEKFSNVSVSGLPPISYSGTNHLGVSTANMIVLAAKGTTLVPTEAAR